MDKESSTLDLEIDFQMTKAWHFKPSSIVIDLIIFIKDIHTHSASLHFSPISLTFYFIMSHVARPAVRQALRGCSRRSVSKRFAPLQCLHQQRSYVSETKPVNATVNIDSTIKAEQKAFMKNINGKLEDINLPGSNLPADMAMSPAAGEEMCFSFRADV